MVPLNGEGSLSSCQDSSEATPMNVSENDDDNEIESVWHYEEFYLKSSFNIYSHFS